MIRSAETGVALLERHDDALLFRRPGLDLTAARFLRDVYRLAADLPETDYVCNLCQDRYRFTVTFAAAALRGQICLLSSDRSAATLAALRERFGTTIAVVDAPSSDCPLPVYTVALPDDPVTGSAAIPSLPAEQVVATVFTSGSTGVPVGHDKSWGSLAARSRAAGLRFGMSETTPAGIVGTVPPQHMYGFETTILLPLHAMAATWSGPA
ncbi:MAG: beta-hydroxyacyl-ACP dehydratase, partial [Proteobacteria bacterium]|nr:beta-hydroxyacyl-ACP dehydratase [Pseudomonadota bacterium]